MDVLDAIQVAVEKVKQWVEETMVQKVSGKGLSTNDYTEYDKNKVENIPDGLIIEDGTIYFAQNGQVVQDTAVKLPVTEETDPTVPAWAKEPNKPTYTASDVGADATGTASSAVSSHNTNIDAHNDIRVLISNLTNRLNALADSDDATLDQLSEIVKYIEDNRDLIEEITTNKVNVSDIINNLTTNVANKPLSAAQGVALKELYDELQLAVDGLESGASVSHTHTVIHKPTGTIGSASVESVGSVKSSFKGTEASHGHTFTGEQVAHTHEFVGTLHALSTSYTPDGYVASKFTGKKVTSEQSSDSTEVASNTHIHKYKPEGSVSAPSFSGTPVTTGEASNNMTTVVTGITNGSAASLKMNVENKCLKITFTPNGSTTAETAQVPSAVHTHSVTAEGTVSQPIFTGTEKSTTDIDGTISVASNQHTHDVTADGSVESTFIGKQDFITMPSFTTGGTISEATITPSGEISNEALTPEGTVTSVFVGGMTSHDHKFTGDEATLTTSTPT